MSLFYGLLCFFYSQAQETFPVNGVADPRTGTYAFTNATIIKDPATTLQNATMVIKDGKVVSLGNNITIPKETVVVDCKGKYIYPSFIDVYSDYGFTTPQRQGGLNFNSPPQVTSNTKGAYSWNQAIKPETEASKLFTLNEQRAKELRGIGFGVVLTHQQDGIARGTGTVVTLGSGDENLVMLKDKAAAFYSFDKGSSTQDYPGSLMGSIALIRQTYLDAQWYKNNKPATEGINLSLQAWNDNQTLPQIFEANNKWNALRADKIAKEFGVKYILKAGGDEYQRLNEIKGLNTTFIVPINFPAAPDVEDPNDARMASLAEMKHWEMAPAEAAMFEKNGINFALTMAGLQTGSDFLSNLRKAIQNGLTETKALEALTKTPATMMGMYDKVGSLDAGKLANFVITNGPIFKDSTSFYQNWIQGKKYELKEEGWIDTRGVYTLAVNTKGTTKNYDVTVKGQPEKISATLQANGDTIKMPLALNVSDKLIRMNWTNRADMGRQNTLSGIIGDKNWSGTGYLSNGDVVQWRMTFRSGLPADSVTASNDTTRRNGGRDFGGRRMPPTVADVLYPFTGYGWKEGQVPQQEDVLIKNATVWTNEKDGILQNTDVLLIKGKIAAVGKNLNANGAKVIDGKGKHLTAGIIDEHSHIAISGGVNECTQAVTAEVRVGDVINPEDISIYRHLSGGVTSEHLLHGSCNPIGGQTQLIKLRWGGNAEQVKFANWDPFIKFALGENVKRSSSNSNNRFPDTRMGVEQVIVDAFQRAQDYQKQGASKRKDLELETLSEILNHKRFITCHSYVQSEINMLMHVADKFGFKVNTFTHILEGYKVADKMKAHGVLGASTFSDWYAYKMEVQDAIAYNAAIMQKVGLVVAVNSDDAEQARHLNQEAAKIVKYGGVSEEEAFKMCTLNPAIMLHIADRVGSIKVGKDADVVLWNDNPLSIYAKPLYTLVDGIIYFDAAKDAEVQKTINQERSRLVQKIIADRRNGGARPAAGGFRRPMEEDQHYD
jgi:imidazolonepropionase-like amidohydrolase